MTDVGISLTFLGTGLVSTSALVFATRARGFDGFGQVVAAGSMASMGAVLTLTGVPLWLSGAKNADAKNESAVTGGTVLVTGGASAMMVGASLLFLQLTEERTDAIEEGATLGALGTALTTVGAGLYVFGNEPRDDPSPFVPRVSTGGTDLRLGWRLD